MIRGLCERLLATLPIRLVLQVQACLLAQGTETSALGVDLHPWARTNVWGLADSALRNSTFPESLRVVDPIVEAVESKAK